MRLMCWVSIGLAIVLAIAAPAPGQPPAQPQPAKRLADPLGRFTIEHPADWKVTPHVIDAGQSGTVLSGASILGYVDVSFGEVPNPLTAEGFGRDTEAKRRQNSADYQLLQDGLTDLAGNRAHYAYYTETSKDINYYSLRVYLVIPVQRAAPSAGTTYRVFWLEGGTRNTPQSVRDNVPLIQRIIWSFRPT